MPTSKSRKEVDGAELCPCESGRRYSKCCRKKGLKWSVDSKDEAWLERPLSPKAIEHLKEMEEEFIEVFGRKPGHGDRWFQLSEGYMRRATLRTMRKAKIRPVLVYAYIQTGLMVADRRLLTGRDQQLWDAAIDEYYEIIEERGDFDPDEEGAVEDALVKQLRSNHRIGGNFVDRHFNKYRHRRDGSRDVESVAGFLVANFVRGMLSVTILTEGEAAYDGYNVLRAMYENYITLAYIYSNPDRVAAFTAQLGILLGTHVYATSKKGVELQSEIIESATGRRVSVPSRWEMAKSLGSTQEQLYQTLYRDLSSVSHSDITGLQVVLSNDGYDYLNPISSINVLSVAHLLSLLTFSLLKKKSPCVKILKHDLGIAAGRSFFELTILRKLIGSRSGLGFPQTFEKVLDELAEDDPHLSLLARSVEEAAAAPLDSANGREL
ncbi:MAG: SEC-C domain-containing protein [Phenylobacterium sp.]|nr:SEC-C domain-containing protein [Phenylobacterium sp.]